MHYHRVLQGTPLLGHPAPVPGPIVHHGADGVARPAGASASAAAAAAAGAGGWTKDGDLDDGRCYWGQFLDVSIAIA